MALGRPNQPGLVGDFGGDEFVGDGEHLVGRPRFELGSCAGDAAFAGPFEATDVLAITREEGSGDTPCQQGHQQVVREGCARGEDEAFDEGEFEGALDAIGEDDEFVAFFSQVGAIGVYGECHSLVSTVACGLYAFRHDGPCASDHDPMQAFDSDDEASAPMAGSDAGWSAWACC